MADFGSKQTFDPLLKEFEEAVDPSVWDTPYPSSQRNREDIKWVSTNRDQLEEYEGKWIAVYEKRVVAVANTGDEAEKEALEKIGHDVPDLFIRFLENSGVIY